MATRVFMEALSPTMEEGRLVKWLKDEGVAVKSGDVLAEVETDKAIMELVARGDGVLRKRLLAEGGTAPVGSLVGVIAAAGEDISALLAGTGAAGGASGPSASASAGGATGPAASASAGGATPAIPAPPRPSPPATITPSAPPAPAPRSEPPPGDGGRALASPLARRLAGERGLDLGLLRGSGPGGRVIKRDIEQAVLSPGPGLRMPAAPAPVSRSPGLPGPDYTDVQLTQIRKTIARRLAESIGPVPTFYLTAEFDVTRVSEMRAAMSDEVRVSFNDLILKATAAALVQHPECNAHWLGDHVRYWSRVHLGMAVATDDGLIVPVIRDADRKGLGEISAEARELAGRARERRLKPEEYTGSTFSVSNLGMMQIDQFTAIINPPECGILAVGAIEDTPVVVDGAVTVRKRLRVTMSCDHRVIDGAIGARFLQTLRRMIENPLMLVY
jgi:pyruvate dehydrogenase E2 component (dihydrolipoamide acetyltransferase)